MHGDMYDHMYNGGLFNIYEIIDIKTNISFLLTHNHDL